VKVNGGVLQ